MAKDSESQVTENTVTRAIRDYKELDSSVAANLIVERLESRIFTLARKRAENKKIRNDVADLVNDSFLKLFQQLKANPEKVNDSDSLWSILANILRQKTVDRLRHIYAESRGGSGRQTTKNSLGNYLVEKGLITEAQLETIGEEQKQKPAKKLEDLLVSKGIISDEDLTRALLQRPQGHKEQEMGNELSFDQFSAEQTTDDAAEEIMARFIQFVESLDDPDLLTIVTAKADGRSNEDIGLMLGVSRESVRRKFAIIKRLAAEQCGQ